MTVELYQFEWLGVEFELNIDVDALEPDAAVTTAPPNLRVIEGSWPTWRMTIDNDLPGAQALGFARSVAPDGSPHPAGNLMPDESRLTGYMMMIGRTGYAYRIPNGWGAVSRLYSTEEWQALTDRWESKLEQRES